MSDKDKHERRVLIFQRTIAYIVLVFLTILCLFSFYMLIVNATRAHPDIQKGFSMIPGKSILTNLNSVFSNKDMPALRGTFNSLFVSTCTAALSVYFSAMTAYAIHVYDFKMKNAAFMFILLIMMVPTQVSTLGFIRMMMKVGLMDSYIPLILPGIAAPVVFFFIKQYMDSSLSIQIVEAARIDGSNEFRTFNSIVLPIMKPALAVQAIFTFVGAWNNYFVPSLLIKTTEKKTLPILIALLRSADYAKFDMGQVYMLIAVAIVPVIIVYLCLSKFIVSGLMIGSVKG